MSVETIGAVTATTLATQLTGATIDNTKSAWTVISAATAGAAKGFWLFLFGGSAEGDVLVDIGVGANGAEVAIVQNIPLRASNTTINHGYYIYIPVAIAAGARVTARYQASSQVVDTYVTIYLCNDTNNLRLEELTATTYGANTADSGGAGVDPGASINTKGAYAEIIASTTANIKWLTVIVGNRANTAGSSQWWMIDIATGALASETIVAANLIVESHAGTDVINCPIIGPLPISIPSGTRLSARAQSFGNDATDRLIDVTVIGFEGTPLGGHFSASMM